MKKYLKIYEVSGREILDSRGNPTIEAEVIVEDGGKFYSGVAAVPSGASTGAFEAYELRDEDKSKYGGKGVRKAADSINGEIASKLRGLDPTNQRSIDNILIALDGTKNKSRLGANAVLGVSLATARAVSSALGLPLYKYLGGVGAGVMPVPMMNILNGGAHASNNVDIQEFMIMPVGAANFKQCLRWCAEVFHTLKSVLIERGLATSVGDEGGFAPNLNEDEEAFEVITEAVERAGYKMGKDFMIAIDAATSEWFVDEDDGYYKMPKSGRKLSREQLAEMWLDFAGKYSILSIEDGMAEEDWDGWRILTKILGNRVQLVGDDLFVTNVERIEKGISNKIANSVLIKLNQIGTLTETIDAIQTAHRAGYTAIVSHRSGETEDTTIADLAVALNCGQIKTGAPSRTDRVAKYNRLLKIEDDIGAKNSKFPGMKSFFSLDR